VFVTAPESSPPYGEAAISLQEPAAQQQQQHELWLRISMVLLLSRNMRITIQSELA
jgi:hypothetical protein